MEELLLAALDEPLRALRTKTINHAPAGISALRSAHDAMKRELERLEARISRLHEFLEDGTYDRDTFRARLARTESEIASLQERQRGVLEEMEKKRNLPDAAHGPENALALYPTLSAEEKNLFFKAFIERIDYTKYKKTNPRDFSLRVTLRQL